jgi:hypothetical protein
MIAIFTGTILLSCPQSHFWLLVWDASLWHTFPDAVRGSMYYTAFGFIAPLAMGVCPRPLVAIVKPGRSGPYLQAQPEKFFTV